MRYIDEEAIENISVGAAFLGTGGGGDPYVGKMMALSAVKEYGPVSLIDPNEAVDDGIYLPSASMGAPSILIEKYPAGDEFIRSFEKLSKYLNVDEIAGTFPMEAGGVNSMIPIAVAAQTGLPVVDGDGMGRAFPELQMTTFHLGGVPVSPMTMTDEKGNLAIYETIDNIWSERIARAVTSEMGGSTLVSLYPCNGKQLKENAIPHIMTLSENIGKIIRSGKDTQKTLDQLLEVTNGYELMTGKVIDISRSVHNGFNYGEAKIEGLEHFLNQKMSVHFQNENLIATRNGEVVATTPDLIIMVDLDSLEPATTESLKYGKRVRVIGMPSDKRWRTDKGIETVGPQYFGYEAKYEPVEDIYNRGSN